MTYNIINIDLSTPRIDEIYNLSGDSIKVINATSDCFIQFEDTSQDPINLLLVDEIKVKFKKFYLSNVGVENKSIKIVVSDNFNLDDRINIADYIKAPIPEPIPEPIPDPTPTPTPFLPGFGFRIPITIPHTKVIANEINSPIYIRLRQNNFDFTKARNDGLDVCFTQDDGQTLLDFERDRHDGINLKGDYMVKIPNISSSIDNKFFMYYGNPAATDISNPTAVWDANFIARWSLKEDPTGLAPQMKDSSINTNHGVVLGGMTTANSVEGQIGKALSFDGVNDYVEVPNSTSLNITEAITLEFWVSLRSLEPNHMLIDKHRTLGYNIHITTSTDKIRTMLGGSIYDSNFAFTPADRNNFFYIIVTFNRNLPTNQLKIYVQGLLDNTFTRTEPIPINIFPLRFGVDHLTNHPFDGLIDEIRISNISRSDSWINLQYQSQNNTLLSFGLEEST